MNAMGFIFDDRAAVLSDCGRYRYELTRTWGAGQRVCWVMLNPSTADANQDDPTIRRVYEFSRAWGFGSLVVVNLFALRATDPKALRAKDVDPVGPENDRYIRYAADVSERIICAWGAATCATVRASKVVAQLGGKKPWCLGRTKSGAPRHPLYVPAKTKLVEY